MYYILKTSGVLVSLKEKLHYVYLQKNGCYGICSSDLAEGVCVDGVVYHLCGKEKMFGNEEDIVLLNKDSGDIITNFMSQISAYIFDQQYRLTMLELIGSQPASTVSANQDASKQTTPST